MYSTHDEGKTLIAARFIRTLKNKNVKSSIYIDSSKEINAEKPKFKIGDIVRLSKCKNIFAKSYVPNCSEGVFVTWKIKNTVP